MNNLEKIGQEVIYGLLMSKELGIPYYVKDNFYLVLNNEDKLFISDEEIFKVVEDLLPKQYVLEIIPVEREFVSDTIAGNFPYGDIELQLVEIGNK